MQIIKAAYAAANEVTNPALGPGIVGLSAGAGLAFYIAQLWKTVVIVGGLAVMLFMIWGGIQWLMAGGDKAKLEEAPQDFQFPHRFGRSGGILRCHLFCWRRSEDRPIKTRFSG